jgi:hypothetical protein
MSSISTLPIPAARSSASVRLPNAGAKPWTTIGQGLCHAVEEAETAIYGRDRVDIVLHPIHHLELDNDYEMTARLSVIWLPSLCFLSALKAAVCGVFCRTPLSLTSVQHDRLRSLDPCGRHEQDY